MFDGDIDSQPQVFLLSVICLFIGELGLQLRLLQFRVVFYPTQILRRLEVLTENVGRKKGVEARNKDTGRAGYLKRGCREDRVLEGRRIMAEFVT